jgi:hypothetical protein
MTVLKSDELEPATCLMENFQEIILYQMNIYPDNVYKRTDKNKAVKFI